MSEPGDKFSYCVRLIQDGLALGRSLPEIERGLRFVVNEEEIALAIAEVRKGQKEARSDRQINTLREVHERDSWFSGPSAEPTSHWQLLVDVLRNKSTRPWTAEMVQNLDFASNAVVSELAPPKSLSPRQVKGLTLGYVQSGKTANFSAVISKSVDAGYKLVIVLAGMHNILRKQTQARLHEEICTQNPKACTTLTTVDENGDFQKRQPVTADRALGSRDGFTLVVLKKNSTVLRNFNSWLEEATTEVVDHCPALIIDDESDQASVNTSKPEEDPKAINGLIRSLVKRFPVVSYVGYTATPFANVLIDSEIEDDLFPKDFLVTLDKPEGYVGAEELFGRDAVEPNGASKGLPVIRTIPDDDLSHFLKPKKNSPTPMVLEPTLAPSLLEALDSFLLGSAGRLARGHWRQHMTMLIHTSHLVSQHQEAFELLERYILDLKLDRSENADHLKARFEKLWIADFQRVSDGFRGAEPIPFEKVWKNTEKFIERIELVMENHTSEERLTYDRPDPFWGVVVGGNTLSRGLTLEGLTTSYFVRGSKGYDTLLQMGRWFGYRPNYVDLTRIYVTEGLQSRFYHLATVEEEIRQEIRAMGANGERPCDVGLRIRTHPTMVITSNLKMRTAKAASLTYSGAKIQGLYLNAQSKELLDSNLKTTRDFLDSIEAYGGKRTKSAFEDRSACILYRSVKSELVLQFLDRYKASSANSRFSAKMISEYIIALQPLGELTEWSIAVMSSKSGSVLDLGNDRNVFMVDRSYVKMAKSEIDPSAIHLKTVTAPRDEMIDLDDVLAHLGARNTDDVFTKVPDMSDVAYRLKVRPKERGLMMIYPINPHLEISDEVYASLLNESSQTVLLRAASPAIGVAFVFPETQNSKSRFKYIVNGTI